MLQPPAPPAPPTDALERLAELRQLQRIGENEYSAAQTLDAARASRTELRSQLSRLEDQRSDLARDLERAVDNVSQGNGSPAVVTGLETRIADMDARITALDAQVARADQQVATATAVPGAVVPPPPPQQSPFPEELIAIPIVLTIFVLFPIAIAFSRRLWKKGATVVAPVPQEVRDRLDQMSQAVDAVAFEVERIGEGQRFITKVMAEMPRSLGAGEMPYVPVARQAERVEVPRSHTP